MDGQAVAAQLMLELTGATLQPGTVDVGGPGPEPKTLRLRDEKVTRLLGTEVPLGEQRDILERLEFGVTDNGDSFDVTVPYFRRYDVTREVDLIEEVARLWGLEKLPATIPGHGMSGRLTVEQQLRRRAGDALVGAGFSEAIGWSFQAPETARKLRLDAPAVRLRNPLSEDLSDMRTSLLGSLLESVRHNTARGRDDVRLFEEGTVYFDRPHGNEPTAAEQRSTPLPDEQMHLAALMTGRVRPASWSDASPSTADFFAAKGVLETLLNALRVPFEVNRGEDPFLHPGRAARVLVGGEDAGWLGEVHPGVASEWDLSASRASSSTSARCCRTQRRPVLRGPDVVPGDPPGPRVLGPRRSHGGRADRGGAGRRRQAPARRARVRRVRARGADVAGRPARVPRHRSHADRRGDRAAAREDRRRACATSSKGSCVASVAVLGAAGYAGAIAAQILYRHPSFELAHVTARAEAGQRLDDVHPRTRVPLQLEAYDADKHAVDAAVVAYPHGAAAPVVAELRDRGTRVVDLSADFRLRDRGIYEDWYGEHKAPNYFGQGVYGLPELTRDDSPRPTWWPTPAATRPPRCSGSRRSRGPA